MHFFFSGPGFGKVEILFCCSRSALLAISVAGRDIHSSSHVTGSLHSWEGKAQLELHAPECYRPLKPHFLVLQLFTGSERPKFKAGLCSSE